MGTGPPPALTWVGGWGALWEAPQPANTYTTDDVGTIRVLLCACCLWWLHHEPNLGKQLLALRAPLWHKCGADFSLLGGGADFSVGDDIWWRGRGTCGDGGSSCRGDFCV